MRRTVRAPTSGWLEPLSQIVVGIRFEPSAHREPLGRLVSVPALLVCHDHFHDVVAEAAEGREKFRKEKKVADRCPHPQTEGSPVQRRTIRRQPEIPRLRRARRLGPIQIETLGYRTERGGGSSGKFGGAASSLPRSDASASAAVPDAMPASMTRTASRRSANSRSKVGLINVADSIADGRAVSPRAGSQAVTRVSGSAGQADAAIIIPPPSASPFSNRSARQGTAEWK